MASQDHVHADVRMERSQSMLDMVVYDDKELPVPRQYKRSKTITTVDWKVLLAFNPPPGYRVSPDSWDQSDGLTGNGSDVMNEREDKVLAILRNILRDLESEIREDKKRLKEEKRLKREERRRRRQETINTDMSQFGTRRTFRTATPSPFSFPASPGSPRQAGQQNISGLQTNADLGYIGVNSLSRIEENPGIRRTGSSIDSDWSRHAHEPNDETDLPLNSVQDSISTTETITDNDTSCDVNEASLGRPSMTPVSPTSISRAKTSYVNDEVQNKLRNNYIRAMDVRKRRLVFRKQMNRMDVLPNYRHNIGQNNSRQSSIEETDNDTDQPFSIKALTNVKGGERTTSKQSVPNNAQHFETLNESDSTANEERQHKLTKTKVNSIKQVVSPQTRADTTTEQSSDLNVNKGSYKTHIKENENPTLRPLTSAILTTSTHVTARKPTPPQKPVRNKLKKNYSESSLESSSTLSLSQSELWKPSDVELTCNTAPVRGSRPLFQIRPHGRRSTGSEYVTRPDTERSHSGTSGYSTDEHSYQTSESEEDETGYDDVTVANYREQLNKYFMVLRDGEKMAVMLEDPQVPAQEAILRKSASMTSSISMSDLAIPDHVGWIIHQTEQRNMWGVVVDMLFCIFESQESDKPEEIILLPGCNIRPLVYKTAINGLNTRQPAKTITGIAKYQIVIDNASTRKKHLFGLESATELDTWFKVLKRASTLDPESTNELASLSRQGSVSSANDIGAGDVKSSENTGYTPTNDSMSRAQKLSSSPLSSPRSESPKLNGLNGLPERCNSPSFTKHSPRGTVLVRHDSRRHSIQDIKKHLRRESDQETSKNQPLKAHHFVPQVPEEPGKPVSEKKLRSFGSFESLLKFKKKRKKKHSLSEDSNDETGSVISSSSTELDSTSHSVDIGASSSKLKKTKRLSRSLEFQSDPKKGNTGLARRASDIKDKVFPKRTSKTKATLGDLKDVSIHGFLYHKYHLKWHKLWCVVCRGCFYGFKSQTPNESAQLSVMLANCAVVYVARKDKREKHLYVFKLSQEGKKSIYLCSSDYRELQQWLTVLQMESNSVLVNAEELRPFGDSENDSIGGSSMSSSNGSILNMHTQNPNIQTSNNQITYSGENNSRSRSKKKKQAPPKPPRHSSCPPSVSRDPVPSGSGSESSTTDDTGRHGRLGSHGENTATFGSQDPIPQHDKALVHVWQNDRGYLFNVIRSKLTAYRARKNSGDALYNKEQNGFNNEGILVVQDASKLQCQTCSKRFTQLRSLKLHYNVHTDEKPQECDTCRKTLRYIGNFRTHLRIHLNVKPFKCLYCGMSFTQTSARNTHLKTHTSLKMTDTKKFMQNSDTDVKRRENGEISFWCSSCNKGFCRTHVTLKTSEAKKFTQNSEMGVKRRESGEKLFLCLICNEYCRAENLERHFKHPLS